VIQYLLFMDFSLDKIKYNKVYSVAAIYVHILRISIIYSKFKMCIKHVRFPSAACTRMVNG